MLPPIFTIVRIGLLTVATTDQIPSLAGYGPLASLAFTGQPHWVVNYYNYGSDTQYFDPIYSIKRDQYLPAYYNLGRYIELDVVTANTANLNFHRVGCYDSEYRKLGFSFLQCQ